MSYKIKTKRNKYLNGIVISRVINCTIKLSYIFHTHGRTDGQTDRRTGIHICDVLSFSARMGSIFICVFVGSTETRRNSQVLEHTLCRAEFRSLFRARDLPLHLPGSKDNDATWVRHSRAVTTAKLNQFIMIWDYYCWLLFLLLALLLFQDRLRSAQLSKSKFSQRNPDTALNVPTVNSK